MSQAHPEWECERVGTIAHVGYTTSPNICLLISGTNQGT